MQQYLVGLYHGEESGHLVVHCNNSVILIDFGVKQSKDYSFFLEEELFELRLTQSNGRFSYQFIHNEKADTPRNRRQAMEAKTDRWRMVALAVMVVIFFGFWAVQYRSAPASLASQRAALAAGRGVTTTVHIYQEKDRWFAAYQVGSQVREIILPAKDTLSGLGFQLVEGDQFAARYAEKSPTVLHIEWGEVSPAQQARYLVATMNRHRTPSRIVRPASTLPGRTGPGAGRFGGCGQNPPAGQRRLSGVQHQCLFAVGAQWRFPHGRAGLFVSRLSPPVSSDLSGCHPTRRLLGYCSRCKYLSCLFQERME